MEKCEMFRKLTLTYRYFLLPLKPVWFAAYGAVCFTLHCPWTTF